MTSAIEKCYLCGVSYSVALMKELDYNDEKKHVCLRCIEKGEARKSRPKKRRGKKWKKDSDGKVRKSNKH